MESGRRHLPHRGVAAARPATRSPSCSRATDRSQLDDRSNVFNTDLLQALELGSMLDVAEAVAQSALQRKESRGSHQRLDYPERDDENYLKHSLATYRGGEPRIDYLRRGDHPLAAGRAGLWGSSAA